MKRIITTIVAIAMVFCSSLYVVGAETIEDKNDLKNGYVEYSDELTPEDALEIAYDGQVKYGDRQITKTIIMDGLEYGEAQSNKTKTDKSKSGYEEWTLVSQEVLRAYGVIKGHYLKKVAAGMNDGSNNVSFSVSGTVHGINLSVRATFTTSVSYNGPSGTELVCTGTYASHRYFSQLGSGKIVRYTYSVLDLASGQTRTEIVTKVMEASSTAYSNLAYYNANTGYVTLRSVSSNNYTYMLESSWINYVNSQYPWSHVSF